MCICVSTPDPAAESDALAAWFGECLYSPRERASFYIGLLSIGCWIMCQMPQIIHVFRQSSAKGLALGLLVQWIAGDSMNFVGSMLTNQLFFQKASSLLFVGMDLCMIGQRAYYYKSDYPQSRQSPLQSPLLATALLLAVAPSSAESALVVDLIPSCESARITSHSAHVVGQMLGWGATFCYLGSRIPQIMQNHRRKSVKGVSPYMFVAAIAGNFTYAMGILLHDASLHALVKALPWLCGALGVLCLDCFIVWQSVHYGEGPDSEDELQV